MIQVNSLSRAWALTFVALLLIPASCVPKMDASATKLPQVAPTPEPSPSPPTPTPLPSGSPMPRAFECPQNATCVQTIAELEEALKVGGRDIYLKPGTYLLSTKRDGRNEATSLAVYKDNTALIGVPGPDGSLPIIRSLMSEDPDLRENKWMFWVGPASFEEAQRGTRIKNIKFKGIRFEGIGDIVPPELICHPEKGQACPVYPRHMGWDIPNGMVDLGAAPSETLKKRVINNNLGIWALGVDGLTVEDCEFAQIGNLALRAQYSENLVIRNNSIEDSTFMSDGDYGSVGLFIVKDGVFENNRMTKIHRTGLTLRGAKNFVVQNNVIQCLGADEHLIQHGNTEQPLSLPFESGTMIISIEETSSDNVIKQNWLEGTRDVPGPDVLFEAIALGNVGMDLGVERNVIVGNTILDAVWGLSAVHAHNNFFSDNVVLEARVGVSLSDANGNFIENNVIEESGAFGIYATKSDRNRILGNSILNNNTERVRAYGGAITVADNSELNVITGNQVFNTFNKGGQEYALRILGGSGNATSFNLFSPNRVGESQVEPPNPTPVSFATVTSPFTDVGAGDFYFPFILATHEKNLWDGILSAATKFEPELVMSRAQMAAMLCRGAGWPQSIGGQASFTDVHLGDWFYGYVEKLAEKKVIGAESGGSKYFPSNAITRAELAEWLVKAINRIRSEQSDTARPMIPINLKLAGSFKDVTEANPLWPWIEALYLERVIPAEGDSMFYPENQVARKEAAMWLSRAFHEFPH